MTRGKGIGRVFHHKLKPLPWLPIAVFLLLTIGISVSGYLFYQKQKKNVFREESANLKAIADLKAAEIGNWLEERMGDARFIMENPITTMELLPILRGRSSGPHLKLIQNWMEILHSSFHYQNILLLDNSGKVLLAFSGSFPGIGSEGLDQLEAARRQKKPIISDLHLPDTMDRIHLDVVVPILAENAVAGFVFLSIDPADFLYPLIRTWPTPSPSAETLLVRREGDHVLFLNELRHRKNTAMKLRFPIRDSGLPAARAVLGETGVVAGRDYRGIAVWSVVRPVEGTSWFIVAKIDREEIERPIRRSVQWILLVALSLILAAALMILFLWQSRNTRFQQEQLEAKTESEDKFRFVFEAANVAKSITLPTGEINVNKAFCHMLGYSQEELVHRTWQELTPADEIEAIQKITDLLLKGEKDSARFNKRYIHKNGSHIWGDVSVAIRRDPAGKPLHFITTIVDITESKRAEMELQTLSARNHALLEAIPDIIMEVDVNKVYTWANHAGIQFFGTDVIGREASFYFEGEQKTYQTVKPIFNGQENVIYVESWQRRRDGEKRLLAWWCRVLKDAAGSVTGALSSARDITEIKLAENEILRLNEELEQRVQQRTAQLEAANKELEAFSYSVSHDLRAPLRAIDGFSRIVLEEYSPKLDNEARRLLDVIAANTRRMGQLIDDLLAFSRLNRQRITFAPVDLAALAKTVFNELKGVGKGRRIEFKIGSLPAARGDLSMLRQVLQNLLANAVKFSRKQSPARIEFGGRAEKVENIYFVKDNGVGFEMQYVDKLFGVFQRLHSADEFEGTGVGLAIVRRIVARHGGRVWAESTAKGGATFYFSLPKEQGIGARGEGKVKKKLQS